MNRNIIEQTERGPVVESAPGGAAALVRVISLREGVPARLITDSWVRLVLDAVARSTTPCHVIGTTRFLARSAIDLLGPRLRTVSDLADEIELTFPGV